MKALSLALAASVAVITAAPAMAVSGPETFVFRVEAASLNTEDGVRTAYQRLSQEAVRYCRAINTGDGRQQAVCRADVIANVVKAVGDERLNAHHRTETGARQLARAG